MFDVRRLIFFSYVNKLKLNVEHTEPFSEIAAPDVLSDSKRSLSGSIEPLEESDLFFNIDLDRRCDSRLGDISAESCDADLSGDLPGIVIKRINYYSLFISNYLKAADKFSKLLPFELAF